MYVCMYICMYIYYIMPVPLLSLVDQRAVAAVQVNSNRCLIPVAPPHVYSIDR